MPIENGTRLSELPEANVTPARVYGIGDNTSLQFTPKQIVDAGRPFADVAEAVAGVALDVSMNPFVTRQAVSLQVAGEFGPLVDQATNAAAEATLAAVQAQEAVLAVESVLAFDGYAAALAGAAAVPAEVLVISADVSGIETRWVRDDAGTALGGGWTLGTPSNLVIGSKAELAAYDAIVSLPGAEVASINGVRYYKMPAGHPQFGSNPISDLPGWITETTVSGETIRAQWRISDVFGGPWRALETIETNDTTTYSGSRTTQAISRSVAGSGANGPANADSALHVLVKKNNLYGASPGEIDALRVNVFQDGHSDAGGILVGAYKQIGDGTTAEGGLTPIEISMRRYTTDTAVAVAKHQSIVAFSPNPNSAWNGRDAIGFYSENHLGAGFANFLGIADGEDPGDATMQYLIAGFGRRDVATRYFSVTTAARMDLRSYDNGAAVGPTIDRMRASTSPAVDDLLGEDLYRGRNSAAADVTYARAYAAIKDVVSGTEDGIWRLMVMVNGALAQQMSVENGVTIGSGPTQGTGTLNLASALLVAAQTVIDGSRGVRFRTYTPTALASAANAVNTTDKAQGKGVWDMTNNRALFASGPAATDAWVLATGTVAINPV